MSYLLTQILICLLIAFLIGLLVGWWIFGRRRDDEGCEEEKRRLQARIDELEAGVGTDAEAPARAFGAFTLPPEPSEPDDLKKVWGIGKVMESLLNEAGIHTFVGLANASVEHLRRIIEAPGNKRLSDIANEETWADQAAMAANGAWDELKEYQSHLSWKEGGKPTD